MMEVKKYPNDVYQRCNSDMCVRYVLKNRIHDNTRDVSKGLTQQNMMS